LVEYNWIGTHTAEVFGVQPTNKRVKVPFLDLFELEDGKIKLYKTYGNMILFQI
jgi:predicted ester cyclase